MKVISKQKEYTAIKFDDSREFYINVGKYLTDDDYRLEKNDIFPEFIIVDDSGESRLKKGDYILIDSEGIIGLMDEETYKTDYIEIKEEN